MKLYFGDSIRWHCNISVAMPCCNANAVAMPMLCCVQPVAANKVFVQEYG